MVKKIKYFPNVDFDSSKEVSWDTERNAKNHMSLLSIFTEKIKKKYQNIPKMVIFWENFIFEGLFFIFSVTVLGRELWYFVLRSVPHGASFELSKSTFRKKSDLSP